MTNTVSVDELIQIIRENWADTENQKVIRYVGQFFDRTIAGEQISGRVRGNHGIYAVSITASNDSVSSGCSCYIGKHGRCHHVTALALTFLQESESFVVTTVPALETLEGLGQLQAYLHGTTLDDLTRQLRQAGITQKDFAESIGMNPQQITAMKSSERRNRFFSELGATKLACLWVLEHFTPS